MKHLQAGIGHCMTHYYTKIIVPYLAPHPQNRTSDRSIYHFMLFDDFCSPI